MIATTMTAEEFARRLEQKSMMRTPQEIALAKLEEVAHAANELGRQGHKIKRVEIITENDQVKCDYRITVRLVPEFNMQTANTQKAP